MNRLTSLATVLLFASACPAAVPAPLADHPGNVFLSGEAVTVPLAGIADGTAWRALDYDGRKVADGRAAGGRADLGKLPVGWYEVRWGEGDSPDRRIWSAVLQPLAVPTPPSSPIALDVAMAWFYKESQMPAAASLCSLAGVNWVRDRLSWGEMEPKRGEFAAPDSTRYDASARIQSAAGLRVLQVNHSSPAWANPNGKRFPPDLRDAYRFHREVARRWAGKVLAFEPWNEADIVQFGGHTGAEMASFQKAACLGLKAGNPGVIVCLNVFASPNKAILADLQDNAAWPYFDTFNLHHYARTEEYPRIYAEFRAASAGRPLWTTEFSMPVKWAADEKAKEPTDADLRVQSERVAQAFAAALHEGPRAAFYFLLPHYVEGQTQFGIVRGDLTPRPAYVALAAVGRLLADARPLGRVAAGSPIRAYLFRAAPDGRQREVLVAWAREAGPELALPVKPEAVFDHLGRAAADAPQTLRLSSAPVFAVLPAGTAAKFSIEPPPAAPPGSEGSPSPIVLQAVWPQERTDLARSAYRVPSQKVETMSVYAYNFGDAPAEGRLEVTAPNGWHYQLPRVVKLPPGERVELALTIHPPEEPASPVEAIRIVGDFGSAGKPVLSVRVAPEPPAKKEAK